MQFRKKEFHFEILESINVKERFIEDFFDLMDYIEETQHELKQKNQEGLVVVAKKDEEEQLIIDLKIHFPLENENVEELLSVFKSEKPSRSTGKTNFSPSRQKELEENIQESSKNITISKKNLILLVSIFSMLIISGFLFIFLFFSKPSYESLIQKDEYSKAVDMYPEKKDAIESLLFSKELEGIPYLEKYVKDTQSKTAEFDLAYLKQNYEKVVFLSEEADNMVRKTALAVSYYKTGDLSKAFELSQNIESQKLKDLIVGAYEAKAIDELKQLKIESAKKIQERVQTEYLQKNIDKVEKTLEEQKNIKKQLEGSSLSSEKKNDLEKQLKETTDKVEKIKKGDF